MSIWRIARKDLAILFQDRSWLIQLFALPLLFILIFSGILGGLGSAPANDLVDLTVVDLDGGPGAQRLMREIEAAGNLRLVLEDPAAAQTQLDDRQIPRVLTLPVGLSDALSGSLSAPADAPVTVQLVNHPEAGMEETEAVRLTVESAVQNLLREGQITASLEQVADTEGVLPAGSRADIAQALVAQARSQLEASRERPLLSIAQETPATAPSETDETSESLDMAQLAVPGFLVLFAFLTAQATARSIYDEKRVGSFRRLLAAPISRGELLAGKALPNLLVVIVQVIVILGFGALGLPLLGHAPLSLGHAPLALALLVLAIGLCSTGLGILIAALARTENQIGGLSSMLLWATGVLGGSMIPLFMLEQILGPLPRVVPQYWANRGLENLLIRGLGLEAVLAQIGALLLFALGFFAIGLARFDYE